MSNFKSIIYLLLTLLICLILFSIYENSKMYYEIEDYKKNYISERLKINEFLLKRTQNRDGSFKNIYYKEEFKENIFGAKTLLEIYNYEKNIINDPNSKYILDEVEKSREYLLNNIEKKNTTNYEKASYLLYLLDLKKYHFELKKKEEELLKNYSYILFNNINKYKLEPYILYSLVRVYKEFDKNDIYFNSVMEKIKSYYSEIVFQKYYEHSDDNSMWYLLTFFEIYEIEPSLEWQTFFVNIGKKILSIRIGCGCYDKGCINNLNFYEYKNVIGYYRLYKFIEKKADISISNKLKEYLIEAGNKILDLQILGKDDLKFQLIKDDNYKNYIGSFCKDIKCNDFSLENNYYAVKSLIILKKLGFK